MVTLNPCNLSSMHESPLLHSKWVSGRLGSLRGNRACTDRLPLIDDKAPPCTSGLQHHPGRLFSCCLRNRCSGGSECVPDAVHSTAAVLKWGPLCLHEGPVTRWPDAHPSRWAPGQASRGPWLQRGPLIVRLRCSAQPFILPENISVRLLPSGA